ncbi:MAG: DM13 domain-containing protein [Parvibaculales bacterium]
MEQLKSLLNKSFIVGVALGGLAALPIGFAMGVYYLPILVASEGADEEQLIIAQANTLARASFTRDLKGSDRLHWGEGTLIISTEGGQTYATLDGQVSPGPDYKLYLSPQFVDDEASFLAVKQDSLKVADITGFTNFRVMLPVTAKVRDYAAVVVWCERFGEFITAGHLE